MESRHGGPGADRLAVAGHDEVPSQLPARPGGAEVDEPDRLLRGAAARAGDTGHGDRDVGPEPLAGAAGHRLGRLGGHRPVGLEHLGRHAERRLLDRVRVGGHAAEEHGARPWHRGQPRRHEPTGAGLRRGEGEPALAAEIEHEPLDRRLPGRVEPPGDRLHEPALEGDCAIACLRGREDVDVDLCVAGADRDLHAVAVATRPGQRRGDGRLGDAVEAQHAVLRGPGAREQAAHRLRLERVGPERLQLPRRPRQHDGDAGAGSEDERRRRADEADHERSLGNRRLLSHARGEVRIGPLHPLRESPRTRLDRRLERRLDMQRKPGGTREQLDRSVVVGRAEAPGDDEQVAAEPRLERRGEVGLTVTHDRDLGRLDAALEERPCEERPVQVTPVAADELRAGDDDGRAQRQWAHYAPWTPLGFTVNEIGL